MVSRRLPESLKVEYVKWTGGNRFVDVEPRVREVWAGDAIEAGVRRGPASPLDISPSSSGSPAKKPEPGKILIFSNKSSKADELSNYLEDKGIKSVAVTGGHEAKRSIKDGKGGRGMRTRGSNKCLQGLLRPIRVPRLSSSIPSASDSSSSTASDEDRKPLKNPHMLSDP